MARLIQKSGYIKNGKASGYMEYVATRDGVEIIQSTEPATKKQKQFIKRLLKDFPDAKELFEYSDYLQVPNRGTASAFIATTLDTHLHEVESESGYMSYIAQRPRAEKHGGHGLFCEADTTDLKAAKAELDAHDGKVWTFIFSLRREDAERLALYWACKRHEADKTACPITQIPEVQIQQAFLRLYYNLKHQGSHILPDLITNLQSIRERKFLWSVDVIELNKQIAELTSQNQLLATLRESGCVDPDIFISKSNKLTEQLRAAKQAKSRILDQDGDDTIPCTQELITILKRGPETLHDFDGELFGQLIDKVIIESNTSLRFRLKNGLELRESIERTVR